MHATRTKSIAIYARSASAFGQAQALERQVQQARALITRRYGELAEVQVFTDSAPCASSGDRPGLAAMMQAAESGSIQRIVTADVTRLSRNSTEQMSIIENMDHWDIALTTLNS